MGSVFLEKQIVSSARQEIFHFLRTQSCLYGDHKSPLLIPILKPCATLLGMLALYCWELLDPCQTPKVEDHPLSAVCDCIINIFAVTICNLKPVTTYANHQGVITTVTCTTRVSIKYFIITATGTIIRYIVITII
jgi:hypothetical protein